MEKTRHQGRKGIHGRPFTYDRSFMDQVVSAYLTGDESVPQIARRFNVTVHQVRDWRSKFSCDLEQRIVTTPPMTAQEQQELEALKKQNEELARKLAHANLQVLGLETLIDVAEDMLKIDIRKKPGSKQSKK